MNNNYITGRLRSCTRCESLLLSIDFYNNLIISLFLHVPIKINWCMSMVETEVYVN